MTKKGKRLLALMLAIVMIAGLMPVQTQAAKKPSVKKVTLNHKEYVLKKGEKLKLKAVATPKSAKAKLSWKSSNKKVATVNSKGIVQAKASKGSATITVRAGKKKATCKIRIGTPVKQIKASDLKLTVGQSSKISATVLPKKATVKKLTYKSNKSSVASVNKQGKVSALKPGSAKITILASDRSKVKKVIKVTVVNKNSQTQTPTPTPTPKPKPIPTPKPTPTPAPTQTPTPTPTPGPKPDVPKFSISLEQDELSLKIGEQSQCKVTFRSEEEISDKDIIWSSTDDSVAAVVSAQGGIIGLTPGTATITAVSQLDERVSASMQVTVSEEGAVFEEAASSQELSEILGSLSEETENVLITLNTEENQVEIPQGTYENVTLIINAPNASIDNSAQFKQVLIKEIAEDTWCEKSGNKIFIDSRAGHLVVDSQGRPNVYLLDSTESITIDNNGNLQELLIASAAKVLVKGDSTASPIKCEYYNGAEDYGQITTYVPLDIYSTTKYKLVVGPGGEQTAVKVSGESDVPEITGLGTISITIDSTGENRTVVAENGDDLKDLPVTTVQGKICKEAEKAEETIEATVYLVRYSVDITNDNISVYLDGSSTKKTETDDAGNYIFESVSIGNYVIVVEAEGYQLNTQNIYIDSNYNEDRTYEVGEIILTDEAGRPGKITGRLVDVSTGEGIEKGLTVILRKGINNITANEVAKVVSDSEGYYNFTEIMPGQYTIQVRDNSEEPEYMSEYANISVQADATVTRNITLTKTLDSDQVRFVLTWDGEKEGVSADLDIHLYGPDPFRSGEYSVYFSSRGERWGNLMDGRYVSTFASLDVDDKAYEGPETITVEALTAGQYKVFVQDYTNGGVGNQLCTSNPVVKIYKGSRLIDTVKMPQKEGGVWFVGSYNNQTGVFTVADEVYSGTPNTSKRAQIGEILNQLTQFEVIDAAAFSQNQKLIDEAAANYLLKKTTDEQLTDYQARLQELLQKLQDACVMEQIKVEGKVAEEYGYFQTYHNLYDINGSADTLTDFDVILKDAATTYELVNLNDDDGEDYYYDSQYRLILKNKTLGVSTNYYFEYYHYQSSEREYWVQDIKDPGNLGWKREVGYENYGYTGGENPEIGRELKIQLMEGVSIVSREYAQDAEEGTWKYGDKVDLVLHLQKDATGATKDYEVYYRPLGAELLKISDTANRIVEQRKGYYNWYEEDEVISYYVYGENKQMGNEWTAEVSEGATYELFNPDEYYGEDGYYYNRPEKVMVVTNSNGAKQAYNIYYYEDTSDAEIIGIYDPDNMYTEYEDDVSSYVSSRVYYTIRLRGMNSELGKNLQIHTKAGASAKVEYATGSESWDEESSNAKITVTSDSGKERIYYIVYGKSNASCSIRGISSTENLLKKVYLEYDDIYITGSESELGADGSLTIKTKPGYTASYSNCEEDYGPEGYITVTEEASEEQKTYPVYYYQDVSGLRLRNVTSELSKIYSLDISNSQSVASQTQEKYYRVELVGESAECPADLQAAVPVGAKAEITYRDESWSYAAEYDAKIIVTNDSKKVMYLLSYQQDESGTIIREIRDTGNPYLNVDIANYSRTMYLEQAGSGTYSTEDVYMIYVRGTNKELGTDYKLTLPKESAFSVIHKGETGWNYTGSGEEHTYYNDETGSYVSTLYEYADRITVKASNGAQRIYLIAYAQDDSRAVLSGISDKENEYVYNEITSATTKVYLEAAEGEESSRESENVYLVYIKGKNQELGGSYQLETPEGSVTSVIHKGEAGWRFVEDSRYYGYYDEEHNYISSYYYYADRVTVKAPNGTQRIYLIAYAQDDSGAVLSGISDKENEYVHAQIARETTKVYLEAAEGEVSSQESENVYLVYIKGKNQELGGSYQLETPEGSVTSVIHKGEAGWRFVEDSGYYGYYDEEDNYISDYYYYADRVTVKAPNGVERIYLIAYASDVAGAE